MNVTKWNGKPIAKPGWYSGIPIDKYHSAGICNDRAVSSSNLRTAWAKSLKHMHAQWCENPNAVVRKSTREMTLGSAAHHLLLGEDHFRQRFIGTPKTYRDKKTAEVKPWHNGAQVCKDWTAKQIKEGRVPVTVDELNVIVAMSRSLALEPLVQDGLLRGRVELSGFHRDSETGLWLKVRPDVVPLTTGDYVDLKTAADVTTPALQSSIRSYGYHMQGALVWEVAEKIHTADAIQFESFMLVFVESAAPHCARMVPVTDEDLARGRLQNRAMMRKIVNCMVNDNWPGPGEGDLRPLPLSNDERARIDARLKIEGLNV